MAPKKPTRAEVESYLSTVDFNKPLEEAVNGAILERATDPYAFLTRWFSSNARVDEEGATPHRR